MGPFAALRVTLTLALALLAPATLPAQVGASSGPLPPYREIPKGHTVTGFGDAFGGTGGRFGIAPHDGTPVRHPLRHPDRPARSSSASAHRPGDDGAADRGPVRRTWWTGSTARWTRRSQFAEVDLQFNVTGGKPGIGWHRSSASVQESLSLVDLPRTPAGSSWAMKIYFAPHAGFRFFLTDRPAPAHRRPGPILEAGLCP